MIRERSPICVASMDAHLLTEVRAILEEANFEVFAFQKGQEALQFLKEKGAYIIISDEKLLDMSGVETLRQAHEVSSATRRILLFKLDPKTAMEAVNVGHVHQIVQKPIEKELFLHSVKSALERYELDCEMRGMEELIREHHKELAQAHKYLKGQLELGAKIHETLLMGKAPQDLPSLSIFAITEPTEEIDGDFYEFFRPSSETMDLVIGDVMGKGIPAALVGTAVKMEFHRFAEPLRRPYILQQEGLWNDDISSISEILLNVHKNVSHKLLRLEYFVTLFYARFDLVRQKIEWLDLGSTKPIHYSVRKERAFELQGEGFPLGVTSFPRFTCQTKNYGIGDLFVFFSDGLSEVTSELGSFLDKEKIRLLIEENHQKEVEEIARILYNEVKTFHGNKKFEDDATLIVIKIASKFTPKKLREFKQKFLPDLSQLDAVRGLIKRFCHNLPGDANLLSRHLELAINELFCNIVKHGYKNNFTGPIWIHCHEKAEGAEIEIMDSGSRFDPWSIVEPSLFGDQDGGYGWYIVRKLADEVAYLPKQDDQGQNHTRLFKRYYLGTEKMDIHHHYEDAVLIVTPMGPNLDAREAPDFKEKVLNLIGNSQSRHLVLDLHHLNFVDSSGLGSFLSILRRLNAEEGDLKLASMTKPVRSMFELVSMHKIFEIFNSPEEAVLATKATQKP